jgi:glycosyltransferase involved in cell wall biosynthesis
MVKNLPLVSVIIPTYNRCSLLGEAIASVQTQSYGCIEIVVVDDGSTDDTAEMLRGYGSTLKVLEQPNRGVSAARNTGIRSTHGELIAFLDSDDYWLPNKVERQVQLFQHQPKAKICQTEETWVRNNVRVNPRQRHTKYGGFIFEHTLPLCLISPSAVMLRRELFEEVGLFDEKLPACEDYDLWLRITWKYPVHLIDESLIVKRGGHSDQLSAMPRLDKYRIRSLVKILRFGALSLNQRTAAIKILSQKCAIYAKGCRKRGRLTEAACYERLPQAIQLRDRKHESAAY